MNIFAWHYLAKAYQSLGNIKEANNASIKTAQLMKNKKQR
jgi:hypothetical protein